MVFLATSHVTSPKGQLPDEDREIWLQHRKLQALVSSRFRFIYFQYLHYLLWLLNLNIFSNEHFTFLYWKKYLINNIHTLSF